MVSLPNAQQYQEAMQNPNFAFDDPELRCAKPYLNKFHMPISSAGGFAVVFKLKGQGRDWAVRCFTRAAQDNEIRYSQITSHLKAMRLPYTVGFDYIKKGVRINGAWHPILKMEWAEGQRLDEYICQNLGQPEALDKLAQSWLKLSADLKAANIAHGDLQHANVLVGSKGLKLVDYDAMFVPSMKGKQSNETGHRNYQHPERTSRHFDLYVDRFSTWVIYLAIIGFAVDPSMWIRKYDDDSLLLGQRDYKNPSQSQLLSMLGSHNDNRIKGATSKILEMLRMPLEQLPELPGNGIVAAAPRVGGLPGWLYEQVIVQANGVDVCPKCRSKVTKKTNRVLRTDYWSCSKDGCNYIKNDTVGAQLMAPQSLSGVAPLVAPPLLQSGSQSVGQGSNAGSNTGGGRLVKALSPAPGSKKRAGRATAAAGTTGRSKKAQAGRGTTKHDECDQCGNKLKLLNGSQAVYICSNYPACDFTKNC